MRVGLHLAKPDRDVFNHARRREGNPRRNQFTRGSTSGPRTGNGAGGDRE